jgi:ribosomal protein S18 acetylase RimI-like enzyme
MVAQVNRALCVGLANRVLQATQNAARACTQNVIFRRALIGLRSVREGNVTFREYRDSDYPDCETLVDDAWGFEKHFRPRELALLGKYLYTMGSVAMSNYRMAAEYSDEVIGFIFGYNERIPLPKHELQKFSSKLAILKRLLFMKAMKFREKLEFLNSISAHEKNRATLLERGKSEIVLFVVHPAFHGRGIGKRLFEGFRSFCEKSKVESIIVETNKLGAASFYEHIGFKLKGDFESPLHNYVTKDGQACLYECSLYHER